LPTSSTSYAALAPLGKIVTKNEIREAKMITGVECFQAKSD